MIPTAGEKIAPTSPWPIPSASSAIARPVVLPIRLPRLVVASEHECGWRGMPTQQFSRSLTSRQRKLPALVGISWDTELKIAISAWVVAVERLRFKPFGNESGLWVRSTSIRPSSGLISTIAWRGTPSGAPDHGSCAVYADARPAGILAIAARIICSL